MPLRPKALALATVALFSWFLLVAGREHAFQDDAKVRAARAAELVTTLLGKGKVQGIELHVIADALNMNELSLVDAAGASLASFSLPQGTPLRRFFDALSFRRLHRSELPLEGAGPPLKLRVAVSKSLGWGHLVWLLVLAAAGWAAWALSEHERVVKEQARSQVEGAQRVETEALARLREGEEMEGALAYFASVVAAADGEHFDTAVEAGLADLARGLGCQRATVLQLHSDGQLLAATQEWASHPELSLRRAQKDLPLQANTGLAQILKHRAPWAVDDALTMDRQDRAALGGRGAGQFLAQPLLVGSAGIGVLLMERLEKGQPWSAVELVGSATAAEVLANALGRTRALAALQANEERYRALVEGLQDALLRVGGSGTILDARIPPTLAFLPSGLAGRRLATLGRAGDGLPPGSGEALQACLEAARSSRKVQTLMLGGAGRKGEATLEARFLPGADETVLQLRDRTLERRKDVEHERLLGNMLAIFNAGSRGLMLLSTEGRVEAFNQVIFDSTKADLGVELQAGMDLSQAIDPSERERFGRLFEQALKGREPVEEDEFRLRDGRTRPLRVSYLPVFREDGSVRAVCLSVEYLDRLKDAEEALRQAEDRFLLAAKGSNDGLWVWDIEAGTLFVSERWGQMLGLDASELPKRLEEWLELAHPDDAEALASRIMAHAEGSTSTFECEHRLLNKDTGEYVWVQARGLVERGPQGKALRMAGSQTDVHLRKGVEASLLKDALNDPLTGLPNRALLLDRLGRCLARSKRRKGYAFGLIYLDTDNFKWVNNSLGHRTGDRLLQELSRRLELCLRPGDTVGRLGGDEFAVLLDDLAGRDDAEQVAERIQAACRAPMEIDGNEVSTSVSIGLALSGEEGLGAEEMLRDAETAMVRAKAEGRSRHVFFKPEMHDQAVTRFNLEADLRKALREGQIELHYQPIVSLEDGSLNGFEALARWQHPTKGLIMPGEFIPAAEEGGLILPLGRQVFRLAAAQAAAWKAEGAPVGLRISVNLSPRQVEDPGLIEDVEQALLAAGAEAGQIHLEVTEGVFMANRQSATRALVRLRSLGFAIAIDDFGTGYSSLSYLHQLPAGILKIDRSFVSRMDGLKENEAVTSAIITLGRSLGLGLVAEGIETPAQAARLKALGCQLGQGYYFGRPVPAAEAKAFWGRTFVI